MDQVANIAYSLIIPVAVLFGFIMLNAAYLSYMERKVLAHMQARMGPMMTGWHGILQPIADGVKLFFKEDIIPAKADKWLFSLAPVLLLIMSIAAFVAIPFGPPTDFYGILSNKVPLWLTNLNVGILYVLALASVGTYGVIMAGWASNNKYSLLGGFRSAAQMISYEIPMAFAIITVVLLAGSLNLAEIVNAQSEKWFIIVLPVGPVAFLLYLISGVAETNRAPFDLPEAETELVAGFFTEYTGMRFAMFFMAEYANMVVISLLVSILFLGGWMPVQILPNTWLGGMPPVSWINGLFRLMPPVLWLLGKVYFLLFFFIWLRATLPRLRYDQLMAFSWKFLLPLSLATLLTTAVMKQMGLL
ncbi:MAG TPA: NADH-quinone oxidoreductase subunit NuoH [Nitrospiraceae bacterium]|nr:NADH-quinone oxidoreductase subunit NuoH [Nitrospiraceae bacterium]